MANTGSSADQALAAVPFFSFLARDELVSLARLLQTQEVDADGLVCRMGEPGDAFFVVRSGWVKIVRPQPTGAEVVLNLLGPGECFGELSMLDGKPRSATAQALEPTVLWVLSRADFLDYLAGYPSAAMALLTVLAERLRRMSDRVAEASFVGLAQRLARRLEESAQQRGTPTPAGLTVGTGVTLDTLAAMLGVSPLRVRLLLHTWESEGLVHVTDQGDVTILREEELLRLA